MAKDKKTEQKIILEREYTIPLRKEWLKVAKYKRANRAIKAIKNFLVRHMKIYDRDLKKIKIDVILNNEIRFRGMRKPPAKIRVKAKKYEDESVRVELVNIPEHVKFEKIKKEKIKLGVRKKIEEKIKKEEEAEKKESGETKGELGSEEIVRKEDVSKEKVSEKEEIEEIKKEDLKIKKEEAKEAKHVFKEKSRKTKNIGYKRVQKGR